MSIKRQSEAFAYRLACDCEDEPEEHGKKEAGWNYPDADASDRDYDSYEHPDRPSASDLAQEEQWEHEGGEHDSLPEPYLPPDPYAPQDEIPEPNGYYDGLIFPEAEQTALDIENDPYGGDHDAQLNDLMQEQHWDDERHARTQHKQALHRWLAGPA